MDLRRGNETGTLKTVCDDGGVGARVQPVIPSQNPSSTMTRVASNTRTPFPYGSRDRNRDQPVETPASILLSKSLEQQRLTISNQYMYQWRSFGSWTSQYRVTCYRPPRHDTTLHHVSSDGRNPAGPRTARATTSMDQKSLHGSVVALCSVGCHGMARSARDDAA
jgi:hypothetical protein